MLALGMLSPPIHSQTIQSSLVENPRKWCSTKNDLIYRSPRLSQQQTLRTSMLITFWTHSSIDSTPACNTKSGSWGFSYSWSIPVKPLIFPALAFLYNPLTSLRSHISSEVSTKHSIKTSPSFSWILLATARSLAKGLIKLAKVTVPLSANKRATSAMRRMFSLRSFSVKVRSLFSPWRMLSPSSA